jgi:hypothetical protein
MLITGSVVLIMPKKSLVLSVPSLGKKKKELTVLNPD